MGTTSASSNGRLETDEATADNVEGTAEDEAIDSYNDTYDEVYDEDEQGEEAVLADVGDGDVDYEEDDEHMVDYD